MLGAWELRQIQEYFHLDKTIIEIKHHIELLRKEFYTQTMTSRTLTFDESIVTVGFNVADQVTLLVDNILLQERVIEEMKKRQRYLNDYLNSLDPEEKAYLIRKYTKEYAPTHVTEADINLYDEILEIEEAINFMKGCPPDNRKNFELDNDSLEEDFDEISELLGV